MLQRVGETVDPKDAVVKIKDASFPAPFASELEYNSPVHGNWNIVHTGMQVPEAIQIYVCADNCMRGVVLTAAEMNAADRFSFVIVEEQHVLNGNLEDITIEGVTDVLNKRGDHPKAVLLFTVCLHHFVGSNLNYIYDELERRFPDNEHRLESYYQVYLMALKTGNTALATEYKNKLMNAFPESDYAVAVADPNYEYNIRMMDVVQDSIYQATYDRYLESDTAYVRKSFRYVSEKYPLATLMPKFMFLDALSYVQAGDAEGFKNALKALVEKYPNADVTELAGEMLKGVLRGRALVQGGVKGMSWNLRFGLGEDGMLSAEDSARVFNPERNTPYQMLLVYPTGSVDQNQLLFAVAAYNFANFMVKEFDLALEQAGPISMLAIKGFISFDEIIQYYKMIYGKDGYATALNKAVAVLPISDDNYETLMRGKTLDEYITFFDESFGEELPDLAGRWKARMEAAKEEEATEDEMITEEEAEVPEEADELKLEVEPEKQPVTEPEEEQRPVQEPVRQPAIPVVPDTIEVPAFDKPEIQRVDTLRKDTVPVVQPAVEDQGMTLKEIQEIRKREAAEEEASA